MLLGFAIGIAIWLYSDTVFELLVRLWPSVTDEERTQHWVRLFIGLLGGGIFALPSLPFITNQPWKAEYKALIFSSVLIIAIVSSNLLDNTYFSKLATVVDTGVLIAALILFFLSKDKSETQKQ